MTFQSLLATGREKKRSTSVMIPSNLVNDIKKMIKIIVIFIIKVISCCMVLLTALQLLIGYF